MTESGSTDLSISTREMLDAIFANAHTTNTFSDDAVDPALIAQAYEDVRWAPTAMNSQPMRLTVVHTPAAKQQLGLQMKPGNRDKTLAAPLTIIAAWDPNWHDHLPHLAPHRDGA